MSTTKRELRLYKDKISYYHMKAGEYHKANAADNETISQEMLAEMKAEIDALYAEAQILRRRMEEIFKEMPAPHNMLMYRHFVSCLPICDLKKEYPYSEQHIRRLINEAIQIYETLTQDSSVDASSMVLIAEEAIEQ